MEGNEEESGGGVVGNELFGFAICNRVSGFDALFEYSNEKLL